MAKGSYNSRLTIDIRQKLGISQHTLARFLEVTQMTVWRYENDEATPRAEILAKIYGLYARNGYDAVPMFRDPDGNIMNVPVHLSLRGELERKTDTA